MQPLPDYVTLDDLAAKVARASAEIESLRAENARLVEQIERLTAPPAADAGTSTPLPRRKK